MKIISILFLLILIPLFAHPQFGSVADSLLVVLDKTTVDTQRVHLLNDLAWEYKFDDEKQARVYLQRAIALAQKIGFLKGEAQAYNNSGVVAAIQGKIDEATDYYQKALVIRDSLQDQAGVASLYNNIGNLQEEKGNYEEALINLQQSLRIRQTLRDTSRIARVMYNISYVHEAMGNYPEALDFVLRYLELSKKTGNDYNQVAAYNLLGNINSELELFDQALANYQDALTLAKTLDDDSELAIVYNNLGNILDDLGEKNYKDKNYSLALPQLQQALSYHRQSLTISQQMEDEYGEGNSLNNIGVVLKNVGSFYLKTDEPDSAKVQFDQALVYLNNSLKLREDIADRKGIMEVYNGMGDVYRRMDNSDRALHYTQEYLEIAYELGDSKFIQKAFKDLSRVYADRKEYKKAYKFRKKYDETRYERLSEDQVKQNTRRQAIFGDYQVQLENERQEKALALQKVELKQATFFRNTLFIGALGLLLVALLLYNRYRIKNKANQELAQKNLLIDEARKRNEDLLLNILPAQTAKELMDHGKAAAKQYDSVTVLFSDIVSFTQIAEQLDAEELVNELDRCFRGFDEITKRHGIEKIKTIGDSYMCAGGIPVANKTHPTDVVKAGLEMQEFMNRFNTERTDKGLPIFAIRIGIHTGPVVAGIVGSSKFAYDIWGDTVNLASRMESGGEAGKVNLSQATYELVKDNFNLSPRGKIDIKNKGAVDMYFAAHLATTLID